jgi:RNA polymerase-binding transcription factor
MTTLESSPVRPPATRRASVRNELRVRLERDRQEREVQLQELSAAWPEGPPDEVVDLYRASVERVLRDIDAALHRLEIGTYGTCDSCRQPIPAERLKLVPYARRCVRCADRAARGR